MNSFCFGFLLIFGGILLLQPAPTAAFIARSTGCHHNGTWYADKSLVPTIEKCLNCQCLKKTLVCRLKVCPEMPMPPPRGCVIVQKKHTCCPYLSCARLEAFYKIPITRRIIAYLDHYERESIDRVVNENMLQRRSDDSDVDTMVCVKNGTVYKSGSAMSSSNLCSYCYCIGGNEKCVKPKCMLPVEGCKPIFVDSTCCPVRYDCSAKTSGKSSQEVRYRKTANKHFQRMSQRLQRNRGCTVNKQFYAEGQKMKTDVDKPCDICFCIRGTRRCAPKKCAPALKNCIPVVPKGQCCPSSYDCGSQRDYRRSHNSRQFNLFSLLFGKDDEQVPSSTAIPAQYPHDRDPNLAANKYKTHKEALEASSEKSIFDTLREGLEFIDGNTKQMLAENQDLLNLQAKRETIDDLHVATTTAAPLITTTARTDQANYSTTTELSFLDLLLGEPVDLPKEEPYPIIDEVTPTTPSAADDGNQDELSWVDILLGPAQTKDVNKTEFLVESSTKGLSPELITSIDRLDDDVEVDSGETSGEILVGVNDQPVKTLSMLKATQQKTSTTKAPVTAKPMEPIKITPAISKSPSTVDSNFKTTIKPHKNAQENILRPIPLHSAETAASKLVQSSKNKTRVSSTTTPTPSPSPTPTSSTPNPSKQTDILSAFLDGITDILSAENFTDVSNTNSTKPSLSTLTSTKETSRLPIFKPLPTHKQHTRINSKIANLTTSSPKIVRKPLPSITKKPTMGSTTTSKPAATTSTTSKTIPPTTTTSTTTTSTTTTTTTKKPRSSTTTTTVKPLIIKTNPTILEAESLEDEGTEPTLPPSLPNLKIIPFLPTDAVDAAANTQHFEYASQAPKPGYDSFEDAQHYPAITESAYVSYAVDMVDDNKAKYIYKFKVEGPAEVAAAPKPNVVDASNFLKYEFVEKNRFSPPTKTEGGFMPKAPLPIDDEIIVNGEFNVSKLNEIYPATMHIIDITTPDNLTQIIEITTPDPFKDVIHTEAPPDLAAVIHDKLDIEHVKVNSTYPIPWHSNATKAATLERNAPRPFAPPATTSATGMMTTTTMRTTDTTEDRNSIETLLDILFKDEHNEQNLSETFVEAHQFTTSTIPPFKNLPQTTMALFEATKTTTKSSTSTTKRPQRIKTTAAAIVKNKSKLTVNTPMPTAPTGPPTKATKRKTATTKPPAITSTVASASTAAKLIVTTNSPIFAEKTTKNGQGSVTVATTKTPNPFLMSPFDKLPFMDASFEIKRHQAAATSLPPLSPRPLQRLDGLDAAYEISNTIVNTAAITATTTTTSPAPPSHADTTINDKQHSMSASNSLIDPTGILKLAGCNIYGRMYRVGRIILELSSPCVECMCTETGVKCGQLNC